MESNQGCFTNPDTQPSHRMTELTLCQTTFRAI
jgi:hypothetical protein